jgi:hypothetical protein
MATWKKVIVSGSTADLAQVQNAGIAANQVVVGAGAGANQTGEALTAGQILMGNSSAVPTGTSVSGDITLSNAGVATIGADKVSTAMLSGSIADTPVAGQTVKVGANGAFTFDDASTLLSAGSGIVIPANNKISASIDDSTIDFNGSLQLQVKSGGIGTSQLADSTSTTSGTTFAKMQHVAANSIVLRDANTEGDLSAKAVADTQLLIGDGTGFTAASLSADVTMTNAGAVTIADDVVTNSKLANMTQGTIKVGGSSDAPTDLDAKTSGQILVGDGTDVVSVAVSGDVTLASNGAVTIANDAVDGNKLADNITIAGNLTVTSDLIVNGTTTEVRTTNLNIEDKFILLQSGSATAAAGDVGIIFGGVSATPTGDAFASGQGSSLFVDKQLQRLSLSNGAVSSGATAATVGAHIPLVTTGSLTAVTQVGNFKVDASGDLFVYAG